MSEGVSIGICKKQCNACTTMTFRSGIYLFIAAKAMPLFCEMRIYMRWINHAKQKQQKKKLGEKLAHTHKASKSSYCVTSSPKFSSGQNFRGRPRWIWRPRLNSSSSTVQKDPNSSSTLIKHLCRDRLVRIAPWDKISSKRDEVETKGHGIGE